MKLNIPIIVIPFLTIVLFGLFSQNVFAVSLQFQGGIGSGIWGEDANKSSFEVDIFLYEGKSVQFFLGGEYHKMNFKEDIYLDSSSLTITTKGSGPNVGYITQSVNNSITSCALILGFKFPFLQTGKLRPYVNLNGGLGWMKREADDLSETIINNGTEGGSVLYKAGIGADYSIKKNLSLGLELSYNNNVYDHDNTLYKLTGSGQLIQFYDRPTISTFGLSIGVRYYF